MPIENAAAQTATNALQAIPFSSLIGGPLDACINAQAKAAQTSWEFIQNVGLTKDPKTGETKAINVTFQYNKNGEMVNLVVPLLTIVPIPFLAINQVIIDFKANISAAASTVNETSSSEDLSAGGSIGGSVGWGPFSAKFNAHANYSSKKDSKASAESKYSVEYTMDVHVEGGQADMPAGLASVLNILQSSLTEAPVGGGITISPQNSTIQAAPGAKLYIEATAKDSHGILQKKGEINFTIEGFDGLDLEVKESRGNPSLPWKGNSIKVEADEKGVAGITIEVKSIDYKRYKPEVLKLTVTSKVDNPNDPNGGTTDVSAIGKIRAGAALPPPSPGRITLLVPSSSTIDLNSSNPRQVEIRYKDSDGNIPDKKISVKIEPSDLCNISPTNVEQKKDDKAQFTLTKGSGGPKGTVKLTTDDGAELILDVTIS